MLVDNYFNLEIKLKDRVPNELVFPTIPIKKEESLQQSLHLLHVDRYIIGFHIAVPPTTNDNVQYFRVILSQKALWHAKTGSSRNRRKVSESREFKCDRNECHYLEKGENELTINGCFISLRLRSGEFC